jgi:hypothetical protein
VYFLTVGIVSGEASLAPTIIQQQQKRLETTTPPALKNGAGTPSLAKGNYDIRGILKNCFCKGN